MNQKEFKLTPITENTQSTSLIESIFQRKSEREYDQTYSINSEQISNILFAAYGITHKKESKKKQMEYYEKKSVPSAGALFPLEIRIIINNKKTEVQEQEIASLLPNGVYKYNGNTNSIVMIIPGEGSEDTKDKFNSVIQIIHYSSLEQDQILQASAILIVCAVFERCTAKYGKRGERYSIMECGCSIQNASLMCASLGLSTCVVGAFHDDQVQSAIGCPANEKPLAILTIGKPKHGI